MSVDIPKPISAKSIHRPLTSKVAGISLTDGLYPLYPWICSNSCCSYIDFELTHEKLEPIPPGTAIDLRFIKQMEFSEENLIVKPIDQAMPSELLVPAVKRNMRDNISFFGDNESIFNKLGFRLFLGNTAIDHINVSVDYIPYQGLPFLSISCSRDRAGGTNA